MCLFQYMVDLKLIENKSNTVSTNEMWVHPSRITMTKRRDEPFSIHCCCCCCYYCCNCCNSAYFYKYLTISIWSPCHILFRLAGRAKERGGGSMLNRLSNSLKTFSSMFGLCKCNFLQCIETHLINKCILCIS